MMYHNITHDDMLNGPGLRVVLWVAGCEHKCKHCQNPITWDPNGGIPFGEWEEAEFWTWLTKTWTQGATFSGGDPLHPVNRDTIGRLARQIKEKMPEKDIWLYTGYELVKKNEHFIFQNETDANDTFELPWLNCIDVLVDRKFKCEIRKKDIEENKKVHWKGSSNQRTILISKTLSTGKIAELEEN